MKGVSKETLKTYCVDVAVAIFAGLVVAVAYYFFQNSNGFAPGGVGGLATITYYLLGYNVPWSALMLVFNVPIFVGLAGFRLSLLSLMKLSTISTPIFQRGFIFPVLFSLH